MAALNRKALVHADQEIGVIRPELHSHFAEHVGSCVYGGIWVGKNSPVPNVNGFRRAAVDYVRELGVPVLRWPGGCFADGYHWRDGIGPAAKRPKTVNKHWGGYTEDNSFGSHEFVEFCRLIGAEPYFAANVGSGSPEEMRDWIEYCNQPSGTTLAEERAANGSREPFNVRYWGVGNELWGCGGHFTAQRAAEEYRRFAACARTVGGLEPYLIGCGPDGNNVQWTRGFMDTLAGYHMDGYSMHFYSTGTLPPLQYTAEAMYAQLNSFPRLEQGIIQQRNLLDEHEPNRRIGLLLDEWGVWDRMTAEDEHRNGRLWQQGSMRSAVAAGLGLNIFNRQADKLSMCNIAQIVNVLQAVLITDGPEGRNCVRTTSYYAFMLFKPHRSKISVHVETDGSEQQTLPDLSLSASRQGGELVATLVNPRHDADMQVDCEVRGATPRQSRAEILYDPDINAHNSFEDPNRVVIRPHPVAFENGRIRVALPAMSVATVTLQVS
ncbi:MAG: Alpha-N-arabinofuranosidase [Bryobacterales bacterium]|jgi:alpha-N-arabinofuranosidase|nr:Alpha-N-arabinofuranosidase [Bryobacterales bacterium]